MALPRFLRQLSCAALASLLAFAALPAAAQNYPAKPIRLVVPFPPGGTPDILSRIIGEHVGKSLGQPVLVENRAGAGGNIGAQSVTKSPGPPATSAHACPWRRWPRRADG